VTASTATAEAAADGARRACRHCTLPLPAPVAPSDHFCCTGCAAAYALVQGLGLDGYYRRRVLDPAQRPPKPDETLPEIDFAAYVVDAGDGRRSLALMIDGLHCAACVWLIESVLARQPGVVSARVNMTSRRLTLVWRDADATAEALVRSVQRLGYRLVPFDPRLLGSAAEAGQRRLLQAMAVAGFAAGNVMLLSVAVWAGHKQGMGPATRDLLHWISALIALPAIVYAGRPFFRSALAVLGRGRTNMDVPISIGVILTAAMSLHETIRGAEHAYFDSAIGLLFFLLIGRYLDRRARGQALSTAGHLLALSAAAATVLDAAGGRRLVPQVQVRTGMRVLVATGERIAVDGRVVEGTSDVDTSLIDGETAPKPATVGQPLFAGMLNLSSPLILEATATGEDTLLSEIARLVEAAEARKGRFVTLADRVSRLYAPVVHATALLTFLGWGLIADAAWQTALLNAIAVLIITCPCALALAVPAVQVVAVSRLLRRGILVKSGSALERLAQADLIVFDKTGTLTTGRPELCPDDDWDGADMLLAGSLAAASKHPLARALVRAAETRGLTVRVAPAVREVPGRGLELATPDGVVRLGSRAFCGIDDDPAEGGPELWLTQPPLKPVRFAFAEAPRADAAAVIAGLRADGYQLALMSGDRRSSVAAVAESLGLGDWQAELRPADKLGRLDALRAQERRVLMVGDGLNDAPALAAAHVSMSPSSAADISQTAADVVFQGDRLRPVREALTVARRARVLIVQNLALAFLYNVVTVPLAVAGQVTPLIAAISMSASSLLVILNALRLSRSRP
jgi:Cu2+-exporting ATPase